jgi:DNA-binding CsgD family transcriptional regulator
MNTGGVSLKVAVQEVPVPRAVHDLPEDQLADCIMSVAESRSVHDLGDAVHRAIGRLTGSPTVGLYLLRGGEPLLLYRRHVADGFIDNYRAGFWKSDPLLASILADGRTADGASLLGPYGWPRSASFELLHHWGFSYNMGGPLCIDDKIMGVLFTATRNAAAPYTPMVRQRMEMLCRAGSLALTNMMNTGHLADEPVTCIAARNLPAPLSLANMQERLPPRSAEVASLVCRGQTNKEIARQLHISDQTVKEHVANLCRRFGAHNRTELVTRLLGGPRHQ